MSWNCPKCKELVEEDDVVNCWNCGFDKLAPQDSDVVKREDLAKAKNIGSHGPQKKSLISLISLILFVGSFGLIVLGMSMRDVWMMMVGVSGYGISVLVALIALAVPPKDSNKVHAKIVLSCAAVLFLLKIFMSLNRN